MKKIKNIWHLVLINGIFDLVFILLFSWVVMYADDYYYASFFKNGISSFISMNIDHYQTFNGRVLVHILAEIVLACKPVLFPLANIAMISCIPLVSSKMFGYDESESMRHVIFVKALALSIPVTVLRESVLWPSASFNYLYPTLMLVLSLYILISSDTKKLSFLSYAVLFLSGATTEQCGLTILFISAFILILHLKDSQKRKQMLSSSAVILSGALTVFLSIATIRRFGSENSDGPGKLLSKVNFTELGKRLQDLTDLVFDPLNLSSSPISPVFLFLLIAVHGIIIYALLKKSRKDYLFISCLLFGGDVSVIAMLATESIFPRTLLPFYLMNIIAVSYFALMILKKEKFKNIAIIAVSLLVCVSSLPLLKGYYHNYRLYNENVARINAPEDGKIYYCWDYDDRYRHTLMHDNGYFYFTYREFYGISSKEIVFYGKDSIPLYCENEMLSLPLINSNGMTMASIEKVIDALGGSIDYTEEMTYYSLNDTYYTMDNLANTVTVEKIGTSVTYDISGHYQSKLYVYVDTELLEDILGIHFEITSTRADVSIAE